MGQRCIYWTYTFKYKSASFVIWLSEWCYVKQLKDLWTNRERKQERGQRNRIEPLFYEYFSGSRAAFSRCTQYNRGIFHTHTNRYLVTGTTTENRRGEKKKTGHDHNKAKAGWICCCLNEEIARQTFQLQIDQTSVMLLCGLCVNCPKIFTPRLAWILSSLFVFRTRSLRGGQALLKEREAERRARPKCTS